MPGSGLLPRTRLEQLVRQSRRTRPEFQKDFDRVSDQLGEGLAVSTRQVARWMVGDVEGLPHAAACRVLEQMFGESAERLFGPPDPPSRAEVTTVEVAAPVPVGGEPVDDLAVQREVAMAAAESACFGQFAEQSNVGPHTLEQFRADLTRIVTTYTNRPVYPIFVELRALRNRAFELLEGRQCPEQSRELYLVAGALCGVLANASFHLGWLPAAETQARTAFLCAELAGNNALRAWVRGTQSLVAYWDERPRAAVELAVDGWRYVPETGTARVRLAAIEARAHARLRDQRAAENALARAEQARKEVRGPDDPGGVFAFPVASRVSMPRPRGCGWAISTATPTSSATRRMPSNSMKPIPWSSVVSVSCAWPGWTSLRSGSAVTISTAPQNSSRACWPSQPSAVSNLSRAACTRWAVRCNGRGTRPPRSRWTYTTRSAVSPVPRRPPPCPGLAGEHLGHVRVARARAG